MLSRTVANYLNRFPIDTSASLMEEGPRVVRSFRRLPITTLEVVRLTRYVYLADSYSLRELMRRARSVGKRYLRFKAILNSHRVPECHHRKFEEAIFADAGGSWPAKYQKCYLELYYACCERQEPPTLRLICA